METNQFILRFISLACSVAGLAWSGIFYYFGLELPALLPLIFTGVVGSALAWSYWRGTYTLLYYSQLVMILVIPAALHVVQGGFHESGVVVLWCAMAPLGGLIFGGLRQGVVWSLIYFSLVAAFLVLDEAIRQLEHTVPSDFARIFFYGMNIFTVSGVIFLAVGWYQSRTQKEATEKSKQQKQLAGSIQEFLPLMAGLGQGRIQPLGTRLTEKLESGQPDFPDSLREMFHHFNQATSLLRQMVDGIKESAGKMNRDVGSTRAVFLELKDNLENHAGQMNAVSSRVREIERALRGFEEVNEQALNASEESGRIAREGGEQIDRANRNFKEISTQVAGSLAEMKRLEAAGREINHIIGSIDEIAERTGLLALNAAIEAARAGEHGRGFSIVADEIAKLTDLTTAATRRISEILNGIMSQTIRTARQMEDVNKFLVTGGEISRASEESLRRIMEQTRRGTEISAQSARANQEQARQIQEISGAMADLLKNHQNVTAKLVELDDAAGRMARQTKDLLTGMDKLETSG